MNYKLRVLLVQLPVPNNPDLNTPLAASYLKAYAYAQGLDAAAEIALLPRHLADHAGDALLVDEIVARRPDLLGISLYTWNSERSLDIVRRVKERLPELRVVVGGPEVQKDNLWVLEHPAVDVAVLGEGEQTFAELLRLLVENKEPNAKCKMQNAKCTPPITPSPHHPITPSPCHLVTLSGIAFRDGELVITPERAPLSDLSVIPSPYLSGYLDVPAGGMLMVEVSRWCPYSCSFCLYGRNMGPKLGSRYFGLERVLAEIRWGRERGIKRVHFVEANLNLVPLFWPLMQALEDLNADRQMTFYAELRSEHLTEEVVAALDRANVRYVEVGLQTANPTALKASLRRTDLRKWAAGTRRLYEHDIEVYLDVILGLPADDAAGVAETLDFIRREALGPYDVFTLQVLPGTGVRGQAREHGLLYQDRPPYYVLATDRLGYDDLRRLRRALKTGANHDPDEVEGCPPPRGGALRLGRPPTTDHRPPTTDRRTTNDQRRTTNDERRRPSSARARYIVPQRSQRSQRPATVRARYIVPQRSQRSQRPTSVRARYIVPQRSQRSQRRPTTDDGALTPSPLHPLTPSPIDRLWLADADEAAWEAADGALTRLAVHVDVVARWDDAEALGTLLARAFAANPSTLFDCYLLAGVLPHPAELRAWRAALPFQPGYLDRVAVYRGSAPEQRYDRVSPRLWLVAPWTAQLEPGAYAGVAEIIWAYDLGAGEEPPFAAWAAAGGAGVWVRGRSAEEVAEWSTKMGGRLWHGHALA